MSLKLFGGAMLLLVAQEAAATNGYFLEGYGTTPRRKPV
jgi:hypothetical protein